jgi:uncharacterized protein
VVMPFVWGLIRRTQGLPMFGTPTVADLEALPPGEPGPAVATPRQATAESSAAAGVHDQAERP